MRACRLPASSEPVFMEEIETTFRALADRANGLGDGWRSDQMARIQAIGIKLFRIDPKGLPLETHPSYAEGLLMVAGQMTLLLDDEPIMLSAGDFQLIPAGRAHAILPGGHGAFVLIDPEPPASPAQ